MILNNIILRAYMSILYNTGMTSYNWLPTNRKTMLIIINAILALLVLPVF